jgi:hypothetical protein
MVYLAPSADVAGMGLVNFFGDQCNVYFSNFPVSGLLVLRNFMNEMTSTTHLFSADKIW